MDKQKIKKQLKETVKSFFKSEPTAIVTIMDLIKSAGCKKELSFLMKQVVDDLIKDDYLKKFNNKKYILNCDQQTTYTGTIEITKNGSGFITIEGFEKDIAINSDELLRHKVIDGDSVEIAINYNSYGKRTYGRIVRVIKRNAKTIIGILKISPDTGRVYTSLPKPVQEIYIHKENQHGAVSGDKVAVKIINWPKTSRHPVGKITEVLGQAGKNDTEMHAIVAQYDLPYKYPERLEKIANKIKSGITESEISKRRDMRSVPTFTIDPKTAKDFDDAISARKLTDGKWEIGIHIADVTYYVHQGDDIDFEGYQRATSIYLVDRTIPMLPEQLSNNLCSLKENEDKLCFSVIYQFDKDGKPTSNWIGKTVIRSNRRFTYEEAQEIIEKRRSEFCDEFEAMNFIAKKLREERFQKGSVDFDKEEPQFELDEEGNPLRVYFKNATDSNRLIEEFMLLANRTVAEKIGLTKKPFIYRVHDLPEKDKFDQFQQLIKKFGLRIKDSKDLLGEIKNTLAQAKGTPIENIIGILAVRTMAKAKYTTKNIGHFGLGFRYYTHFTSPIRRYPDMMVHRLLDCYLSDNQNKENSGVSLEKYCEHCSSQEIKANEAERASIKYKMAQFMQDKIGNEYEGTIDSLTQWGIYVELEDTHIEGMISINSIPYDIYEFNEDEYKVEGFSSGNVFNLGDKVRISVKSVNLEKRQLDFNLVGYYTSQGIFKKIESTKKISNPKGRNMPSKRH